MRYVTEEEVLLIHGEAVRRYKGSPGVRAHHLLESALGAACQTFDGKPLHPDAVALAAAYAFYICTDHPFVDGNKRTAVGICELALAKNDRQIPGECDQQLKSHIEAIAAGEMSRQQFERWLRDVVTVPDSDR